MANQKRTNLIKQDEVESKHRSKQQEPESTFDQFYDWNVDLFSLSEAKFDPRMDEHAELLAQAASHSDVAVHNLVMQLHQTYGNRYVQRLLNSNVVQAKLTVNVPGDIYEQEADRIADKVISAEKSQVQRQEEEEEEEEEEVQAQRQEEEEEELQAQRQPAEEEEEEQVQAQSAEGQAATVSESIEARINNARGSGHHLSENVREPMEQAFGADFGNVRVHTDSEADTLNQHLNARAFTTGEDVFFRKGEYSTGSDSGKKLIAHELTHVVQQTAEKAAKKIMERVGSHATKNTAGNKQPVSTNEHSQSQIRVNEVIQSASQIIQLDPWTPEKWEAQIGPKSKGVKQVTKKLREYWSTEQANIEVETNFDLAKAEEEFKRIRILDEFLNDWLKSNGPEQEQFKNVWDLKNTVTTRWQDLNTKIGWWKSALIVQPAIEEIVGYDLPEDEKERNIVIFRSFVFWCRVNGVKYTNKHLGGDVFSNKTNDCEGLANSLKQCLDFGYKRSGKKGEKAYTYSVGHNNFITIPITDFIDEKITGNIQKMDKRFFFETHYVVQGQGDGTFYDPTLGIFGGASDVAVDTTFGDFNKDERSKKPRYTNAKYIVKAVKDIGHGWLYDVNNIS